MYTDVQGLHIIKLNVFQRIRPLSDRWEIFYYVMPTDMKPHLLWSHPKDSPDFVYFDDKKWGIENKIYYNPDFHETKHLTLLDETNCFEKMFKID